jgi:hypothetical protein
MRMDFPPIIPHKRIEKVVFFTAVFHKNIVNRSSGIVLLLLLVLMLLLRLRLMPVSIMDNDDDDDGEVRCVASF